MRRARPPGGDEAGNPPGDAASSVSEITERIRACVEPSLSDVCVRGEISRWTVAGSGHGYLTLKDDRAVLDAVVWRARRGQIRFEPAAGMEVVAWGAVTVYPPRGRYQLDVRRLEPVGAGALEVAFRQMCERLRAEGLFDEARKRPLPFLPRRIVLVTSPTGAALHDMIRSVRGRHPRAHMILYPVRVQGDGAAGEIADAIALANLRDEGEVMIVGRGGGSPEDLWAFNEEVVARAIHASRIPVVSAVGHETDVSVSDLVADARALTPTAAGGMVVPDVGALREDLAGLAERLGGALRGLAVRTRERLARLIRSVAAHDPARTIAQGAQRVDELSGRLGRAARERCGAARLRLEGATQGLSALSPLGVLARGYSVTWREEGGPALTDAAGVAAGDVLRTRLARGTIRSRVEGEG